MERTIDYVFGVDPPWAFIGLDVFATLASQHSASIHHHGIAQTPVSGTAVIGTTKGISSPAAPRSKMLPADLPWKTGKADPYAPGKRTK